MEITAALPAIFLLALLIAAFALSLRTEPDGASIALQGGNAEIRLRRALCAPKATGVIYAICADAEAREICEIMSRRYPAITVIGSSENG